MMTIATIKTVAYNTAEPLFNGVLRYSFKFFLVLLLF